VLGLTQPFSSLAAGAYPGPPHTPWPLEW
jgi:hypothetical protein